jgi:diguanylate cyclase (GGDEF)-like protein
MIAICILNLIVQGTRTTSSTLFGAICVLITALFVGVVMRLRFPYVAVSLPAMLISSLGFLYRSAAVDRSEATLASSLMVIGIGIILVASYSMEREERRNYLLSLQRDMQAEELALTNAALQRLSSVDKLTGLPNRRSFEEKMESMWAECSRTGEPLAAVVIDVDHFKMVNDVYGHLYGDETLKRIGSLLPQALRSPSDMAARFGGEEFILLLAHTEANIAVMVAERARQLVESAGTPIVAGAANEKPIWITVSCGVSSCIPNEAMTWTSLVAAADEALYAAKRNGRNRVELGRYERGDEELPDLAGRIFFDTPPKRLCV